MAMTTSQRARLSKTIQIILFVAIIAAVVLSLDWEKTRYAFFSFEKLGPMFPDMIIVGLKNTIFYTVISFAFGLVVGLLLALMKMASFAPYRWFATAFVEFFRGIPAILVLLAFGFGLPQAFGTTWPQPVNIMLALGLVSSAYIAETLRAGLQAVPKGQTEAARSLGMPAWRAMVTIVIPQAFKIVLPPMTNEIILLTKDSSLAFILGASMAQYEMTKFGRDGIQSLDAGITPLVAAGLFYLVITIPLSLVARKFESRSARTKR
ncbi:amino acid ABC transporter permease [Glutamicibacter soli]|uniref:ABC transporter permease subunit n=1 Tax=Glutamicibacter soli TaxID=453836 RepID=A0A365YET8_9MICC|nr:MULTISPECIES: amino acid ABC transporter permease [Micrococcaceae]ALD64593.1 ABC transporter permease [Arthrobacter sp. LS16]ALQ30069.1 ABC transporter permease [Arthrobacter sp. YC-RL1]KLI88602.1 ABC transporter permease [Arthrobacter sp. YC-RL1]NAZ16639.1 ABC transporter permease subunit [Glutamicibacter soli]RBM00543.1 amino acid ABC transporter permease [Glutamicibacter soli]